MLTIGKSEEKEAPDVWSFLCKAIVRLFQFSQVIRSSFLTLDSVVTDEPVKGEGIAPKNRGRSYNLRYLGLARDFRLEKQDLFDLR